MDDLPRTTEDIAVWLREPNSEVVAGIREWHGDAAVVRAMELVAELPAEQRARAFLDRIGEMQGRRERFGDWPSLKFARWRGGT